jgi:hypothetical protein
MKRFTILIICVLCSLFSLKATVARNWTASAPTTYSIVESISLDAISTTYCPGGRCSSSFVNYQIVYNGTIYTTGSSVILSNLFTYIPGINTAIFQIVNLGSLVFSLDVTIYPPSLSQPSTPTGATNVCRINADYSTGSVANASSYNWQITPSSAGTVSGTGTTVTIAWASAYSGTATVTVQAVNQNVTSNYSGPLTVSINPIPVTPTTPTGATNICQNVGSIQYSTGSATGAVSYNWQIAPSGAGIISGTGTTANVTWTSTYSGTATINVSSVGTCNTSVASNDLGITVNPLPSKAGTAQGTVSLCQNPANNMYSTAGASNATSYQWSLTPSNAGTITGNTTTSTVAWTNGYTGTATIKVQGVNSCGNGTVSDDLTVTVNPLPLKAAKPTGQNTLCQGTTTTTCSTIGSNFSTSYAWVLTPSNAGNITGTGSSATINWSNTFYGTATVKVRGVNSCGYGDFSDDYNITVNPLPVKANSPTGSNNLCQNPDNCTYATTGATNATSYNWVLSPSSAGVINGVGTSAVIDWDNSYTGTATIKVQGVNSCGNGDFSDNLIVTINPIPGKAATPTGQTAPCQNSANLNYVTTGATNATSYQWVLTPDNTGTVSGTSTTGSVTWTTGFSGATNIKVRGVNSCGVGDYSDILNITVNPFPSKPNMPAGQTTLNQNPGTINYTTTGGANATSFDWVLTPSSAGNISGNTNSISVNWSSTFSGTATLKVRGVNSCGNSDYSDPLTVNITSLPGKAATPTGQTTLCQNPAVITYTTTGTTNATSYDWVLSPSNAGTISGTGTTANVTWASDFTGAVTIKVRGTNTAGSGDYSDPLNVTINPLPLKASTANGNISVCQNSQNLSYITSGSLYATSYQWSITPSNAGTISGTSTTASVSWASNFSGSASIKVRGVNTCGA